MSTIGECPVDLANDLEYMIRNSTPCRLSAEVYDEALGVWSCRRHSRPEFEEARRVAASNGDSTTGRKRLQGS